jgi:hypothetical protein
VDNVEATEAWNGPLFDIWVQYRAHSSSPSSLPSITLTPSSRARRAALGGRAALHNTRQQSGCTRCSSDSSSSPSPPGIS